MEFINEAAIQQAVYEQRPFPHAVIDNFIQADKLDEIVFHLNALNENQAQNKNMVPDHPFEYNTIIFSSSVHPYLKQIFAELNSPEFIGYLENLTGISDIIATDIELRDNNIRRIKNGGHLQLHTDSNTYLDERARGKFDKRVNLSITMNPDWKDEYNGSIWLRHKEMETDVKKISPILNRCVIFNTSKNNIYGYPDVLNVPDNTFRHSIDISYYKQNNESAFDFEGDREHQPLWYSAIEVKSSDSQAEAEAEAEVEAEAEAEAEAHQTQTQAQTPLEVPLD